MAKVDIKKIRELFKQYLECNNFHPDDWENGAEIEDILSKFHANEYILVHKESVINEIWEQGNFEFEENELEDALIRATVNEEKEVDEDDINTIEIPYLWIDRKGKWDDFCEITGTSFYSRNSGFTPDYYTITINQAKKLNFL